MLEASILDTYLGKYWAIKLATNAAVTVLRVDQVSENETVIFTKWWPMGRRDKHTSLIPASGGESKQI